MMTSAAAGLQSVSCMGNVLAQEVARKSDGGVSEGRLGRCGSFWVHTRSSAFPSSLCHVSIQAAFKVERRRFQPLSRRQLRLGLTTSVSLSAMSATCQDHGATLPGVGTAASFRWAPLCQQQLRPWGSCTPQASARRPVTAKSALAVSPQGPLEASDLSSSEEDWHADKALDADTSAAEVFADSSDDVSIHLVPFLEGEGRRNKQLLLLRALQRTTGLQKSASFLTNSDGKEGALQEAALEGDRAGEAFKQQQQLWVRHRKLLLSTEIVDWDRNRQRLEGTLASPFSSAGPVLGTEDNSSDANADIEWPLEAAVLPPLPCASPFEPEEGEGVDQDTSPEGSGAGISFGTAPATPEELEELFAATGCTAVIFLQDEGAMALLGVDMSEILDKAAEHHVPAFRIPMIEHDDVRQAAFLPEAVRVLASLLETGHRVHITCLRGVACSPLVVLGYLTFYQGQDFGCTMAWMRGLYPGVSPSYSAWQSLKEHLLSGQSLQRMSELAHKEFLERTEVGRPGTTADDWQAAQRKLVVEVFRQRVTDDVALSQMLAAARLFQAVARAEGGSKSPELVAAENVRLLAHRVQQLTGEQEQAAGAAAEAAQTIAFFRQQVQQLERSEAEARELLTAMEEREEEARRDADAAEEKVLELTQQLQELTQQREEEEVQRQNASAAAAALEQLAKQEAQGMSRALEESFNQRRLELEEELERVKQENLSLSQALDSAREDVRTAESWAEQLSLQLREVQELGALAGGAGVLGEGVSGTGMLVNLSGMLSSAPLEEGQGESKWVRQLEKVRAMAAEVRAENAVTGRVGDTVEILREARLEADIARLEVGSAWGEDELNRNSTAALEGRGVGQKGDKPGVYRDAHKGISSTDVAELMARMTDVLRSEEEVHQVAQSTVDRLAAAAAQIEQLQKREEELVHAWHTTQEKVDSLAQRLNSAQTVAVAHLDVAHEAARHQPAGVAAETVGPGGDGAAQAAGLLGMLLLWVQKQARVLLAALRGFLQAAEAQGLAGSAEDGTAGRKDGRGLALAAASGVLAGAKGIRKGAVALAQLFGLLLKYLWFSVLQKLASPRIA